MHMLKRAALPLLAGLLTLAFYGCGGSSTNNTIPSIATTFYAHSVVFRNHSTMVSGYNGFGQLGIGNLTNQSVFQMVPGLGHMDGFATGADHTLVFTNNSSVMAWGYNNHGQLGNAALQIGTSPLAYSFLPVRVGSLTHVTSVAAGAFHSLAVSDGNVWSWGYNGFGQLGDSTYIDRNVPVQVISAVQGNTPLSSIQSVAAGGYFSLALATSGRVYAWGNNADGQLGTVASAGGISPTPDFVQFKDDLTGNVAPLEGVQQIAAGGAFGVALKTDGSVWAWGYNGEGQLGRDPVTTPRSYYAVQVIAPPAAGAPKVIKISAGLDHVLALLDNGNVVGWGFNASGQVGNNDNRVVGATDLTRITAPTLVNASGTEADHNAVPLAGVSDIIASGHHSLAIVGNALFGWGDNGYGQLGRPVSNSSTGNQPTPTEALGYRVP